MRWGDWLVGCNLALNTGCVVLYAAQGHWKQAGYWAAALQLNFWLMKMR